MTDEETQTIEYSVGENEVSSIHRIKHRIIDPFSDFLNADRSGRTDMVGKAFLLVPAFASTLIIILILGFLWYESTPILTSPVGGPGIIINPTWDPNRNLFGIAVFIVGSLLCTTIPIGIVNIIGCHV